MGCVFCQIVAGKLPGDIVYRDDEIVAFRDVNPQAPVHLLVIPRKHIASLVEAGEGDIPLMGRLVGVANKLARQEGTAKSGYRLVINCGQQGGQLVPHLHLHLLGGRQLSGRLG
jgi:histidine triad (HIT) family protein